MNAFSYATLSTAGIGLIIVLVYAVSLSGDRAGLMALVLLRDHAAELCKAAVMETKPLVIADDLKLTKVDLDGTGRDDFIVRIESESTCGTAGCQYELCLTQNGSTEHLNFGYAAESLTALPTYTDGRADLLIDGSVHFTWADSHYTRTE